MIADRTLTRAMLRPQDSTLKIALELTPQTYTDLSIESLILITTTLSLEVITVRHDHDMTILVMISRVLL
jgi:hypothetical protein